jgi:hypothetical protein
LILDDLLHETNDHVTQLFTRVSHHKHVSIVYLSQNLFNATKHNRTMSLNSHYIVLMKNVRDQAQVGHLARQMFPKNSAYMLDAFKDATSQPYSYLFIDLKQETDERHRLRTGIFPNDTQFVYVPKR